jgi:hypothetical protein
MMPPILDQCNHGVHALRQLLLVHLLGARPCMTRIRRITTGHDQNKIEVQLKNANSDLSN